MRRLGSAAAHAGLGATLFLLLLSLLRLGPVHAESPLPMRALTLSLPCLGFAIAAALTGRAPRPRPWRKAAAALGFATVALAAVVALRPPAGLAAVVFRPEPTVVGRNGVSPMPADSLGTLVPGPVDLVGADLEGLHLPRRVALRWSGPLRAPESGSYRLWATGRGRVVVRLDGRLVLEGDGERLEAGADVPIGRGQHQLEVEYHRVGPGPRLRLGWDNPAAGLLGLVRSEPIPPRRLGARMPEGWWLATDALALLVALLAALLALLVPWDAHRPLPPRGALPAAEIAVSLVGQLALLAVMSWPLVLDLGGQGVFNRPDGRLNAWILAWDAHALLHEPWRLFQAPIFHPLPDALAFSENLLLPAALTLPAQLMGGPALAYNLALLVGNALSGLGVQLLIRRVTGDRLAAFAGGAFFAAGIHRWVNMAHLHAQMTPFLPFALLALDRFLERRSLGRASVVGVLLALQGASSVYLGAITGVCLVVASLLAVGARRLGGADVVRLLGGFALAGLLLWPLVSPYLRMRAFQGEEFTLVTVANYAATPESYAASAGRFYEAISRRHLDPDRARDPLFPGVLPLALGVAGLAVAPRRYAWTALAASGVALTLSLGPATSVYRFLHENFLLLHGLRALARFSVVPVLALSVLLGLALAGRRRLRPLALLLVLVEANVAPLSYARYEPPPESARWLVGRPGAVLAWPLGEDDTARMLESVAHFRPLVNGDSGFLPRPYARAMELVNDRFGEGALSLLRAIGVSHLVSREERPLPLVARFGATHVYAIPPGPEARVPEPVPPAASLFTARGVLLDLAQEREITRIGFEVGTGDWLDHPRVELSSDGITWRETAAAASLADATLALYRDPRYGRGELRFPPARARFVRLDPRLPARFGTLGAAP